MDNTQVKELALGLVGTILEETTYLFTDEADGAILKKINKDNAQGVSLSFEEEGGNRHGWVHMWVPEEFAALAAANMLGIEDTDPTAAEKGLDALREILNIILGNLLTELFGEEPLFNLALPLELDKKLFTKDIENDNSIWLEAEERPVFFLFDLSGSL